MNLILFDDHNWDNLLPLSYTKPVAELSVGILSIREKWEKRLGASASYITRDYLNKKFPLKTSASNLLINGTLLPSQALINSILGLKEGQSLKKGTVMLALNTASPQSILNDPDLLAKALDYTGDIDIIDYPWKLFSLNGQEISNDFDLITKGRQSNKLSTTVNVLAEENVFVEDGFKGEFFTLNASTGPVYLGKDSEIMEGSVIRGPFSLGEQSTIKLAAKIYGPTSIGKHCKAGGEINNSVIHNYSNKGHDGFLGNSVLGEWCNLGADTNNSNLKNNYAEVKVWNYPAGRFIKTGLQFCGLIMGDHSKSAINTMFNTGTVVGVSANIFGSGFPRNFVPSFSWGGSSCMSDYKIEKAFETMRLVMERRGQNLSPADEEIFRYIYQKTGPFRKQ